jgi:hypothetical protein
MVGWNCQAFRPCHAQTPNLVCPRKDKALNEAALYMAVANPKETANQKLSAGSTPISWGEKPYWRSLWGSTAVYITGCMLLVLNPLSSLILTLTIRNQQNNNKKGSRICQSAQTDTQNGLPPDLIDNPVP